MRNTTAPQSRWHRDLVRPLERHMPTVCQPLWIDQGSEQDS